MKDIEKILNRYFPNPKIPLNHSNPFTLLVAVLLSAQCQDARVNRVTDTLFSLATTPDEMMQLSEARLEEILRPLGLFRLKAKNILALSKKLIDDFNGVVPASLDELASLPGVGHKTASVVLVQAFGIPAFPVDTHIFRAAHRWGLSNAKTISGVEKDLCRLFPKSRWGKIHLQIILFCRKYCPARGHEVDACPICSMLMQNETD